MSTNELNLTKEEITDNNQDSAAQNKIVSIANKVDSGTSIDNTNMAVAADTQTASNVNSAITVPTAADNPAASAVSTTTNEPVMNNTPTANPSAITVDTTVTEPTVNASAMAATESVVNNSAAVTAESASPIPEVSNDIPRENKALKHKYRKAESESRYYEDEPEEEFHFADEERPRRALFSFRAANEEESRDRMILSRIKDEDLMEYLALEQRRLEFLQQAKEVKQKRILTAFQLLISLAAIVAITYLLKDNPTILISILYIVGIIAALNIWKNPQDKGKGKWRK